MIISNEDLEILKRSCSFLTEKEMKESPEFGFIFILKSHFVDRHIKQNDYKAALSRYIKALNENGFFEKKKIKESIFKIYYSLINNKMTVSDYEDFVLSYLNEYKSVFLSGRDVLANFVYKELQKYNIGKTIDKKLIKKLREDFEPKPESLDCIEVEHIFQEDEPEYFSFLYEDDLITTDTHDLLLNYQPSKISYISHVNSTINSSFFVSRKEECLFKLNEKCREKPNSNLFYTFYNNRNNHEFLPKFREIIKNKHVDLYNLFVMMEKETNSYIDQVMFKKIEIFGIKFNHFNDFLNFLFENHHNAYSDFVDFIFGTIKQEKLIKNKDFYLLIY